MQKKVFYIGGWQIFGTSRQQAWDWSRSGLKRVASRACEKRITVVVEPTAAATNLIETDDDALELIRGEISAATFEQWEKIWFMFMSRTAIEHFQGKPDLGLR